MRFRDGSSGQRALFAALLGLYLLGLGVFVGDKLQRVGRPDAGWIMDGWDLTPSRIDAARAGIRGGGRALAINGVAPDAHKGRPSELIRRELGATNELRLLRSDGQVLDVSLPVRVYTWPDVLFSDGVLGAIGLLFALVGVSAFLLRPFEVSSWALLSLATIFGGLVSNLFLPMESSDQLHALYFRAMVGLATVVPFHAGLAFPVVHPLLARRREILFALYGLGVAISAIECTAWYLAFSGPFAHVGVLDSSVLLLSVLFFIGRCGLHAVHATDPLIAQRARILLAGMILGAGPGVVSNFLRVTGSVVPDRRVTLVSLVILVAAIARVTVRHEILNARVTVRRAVAYAVTVGVLTIIAMLLISVSPYLVAALLWPLLYLWPRFVKRLEAQLQPKRARFPELVREIDGEIAGCSGLADVLDLLARAPGRLCDARGASAVLFPGVAGAAAHVRSSGEAGEVDLGALSGEALIQLLVTTRKEIFRDQIALEPRYVNIRSECYESFARLRAELLLPIVRGSQVIGMLALGPRASGDPYEAPEIDALSTLVLGTVQAIARIEAMDRLRAREREFSELKRFFPPQIIEQVMQRGGASELRSQRKLVTVLFADLRGFTSFSDRVEPEEVMHTLAEYHEAMGKHIAEYEGTLERFAGDGFMVFFNDPVEQKDHVERAARMALAMRRNVRALREGWSARGYAIDVGIGIHTGFATCGFIGYEGRRDYGVIGNVTNLAARLSDAAAGGEVLITARVRSELPAELSSEPAGELELKGFSEPQSALRLLGE